MVALQPLEPTIVLACVAGDECGSIEHLVVVGNSLSNTAARLEEQIHRTVFLL